MSTGLLIRDLPAHERPREKLVERGAKELDDSELIAILLRTGTKGVSAVDIGKNLVSRFKSLSSLALASLKDLQETKGVGRDKAIALHAAFTLAQRMAKDLAREQPLLDTPERVAELVREACRPLKVETFRILLLNVRRRLIREEEISHGILDTLLVHPREVFRPAIAANAAAVVLVHNHPSGDPMPSESDIKTTRDLIRAGQLLKIEVLDHVILGAGTAERPKDFVSLRELGYFYS